MEYQRIIEIVIAAVITIVATVSSAYWFKAKQKIEEVTNFLLTCSKAIEDNAITSEETKDIINSLKAILKT